MSKVIKMSRISDSSLLQVGVRAERGAEESWNVPKRGASRLGCGRAKGCKHQGRHFGTELVRTKAPLVQCPQQQVRAKASAYMTLCDPYRAWEVGTIYWHWGNPQREEVTIKSGHGWDENCCGFTKAPWFKPFLLYCLRQKGSLDKCVWSPTMCQALF